MDKTLKIRAFTGEAKPEAPAAAHAQSQPKPQAQAQDFSVELAKKLEEEKNRSLEYIKTIDQLQASVNQKQTKLLELTKRVNDLEAENKQLAASSGKTTELEARIKDLTDVLIKITSMTAIAIQARPGVSAKQSAPEKPAAQEKAAENPRRVDISLE